MKIVKSVHRKNHKNIMKTQGIDSTSVKKDKASKKEEYIEYIVNRLNLSEDVITGAEIITMIGKRSLVIENYMKVIEYDTDKILVKTKRNKVCIIGSNLRIEYLYDVELRITGKIQCVSFESMM